MSARISKAAHAALRVVRQRIELPQNVAKLEVHYSSPSHSASAGLALFKRTILPSISYHNPDVHIVCKRISKPRAGKKERKERRALTKLQKHGPPGTPVEIIPSKKPLVAAQAGGGPVARDGDAQADDVPKRGTEPLVHVEGPDGSRRTVHASYKTPDEILKDVLEVCTKL